MIDILKSMLTWCSCNVWVYISILVLEVMMIPVVCSSGKATHHCIFISAIG